MIGIYLITNQINNKVYVGQSVNIEQRWRAHRSRPFNLNSNDYEKPLYRAIRKYGLDNFEFKVIEVCREEELNEKEEKWIRYFAAVDPEKGYNLTYGGETGVPLKITEEESNQIIDLLLNSTKTQQEIADQFNISQRLVSGINLGEYWIKQDLSYPIRQRKEHHICQSCGKEISYKSEYCITCAGLLRRKAARPEREELKSLIRKSSFVDIGKMYGVSDNAVRKWCEKEGLPSKKSLIKKYTDEDWEKI